MRLPLLLLALGFPVLVACSGGPKASAVDARPRALEPLPANVELGRRLRLSVPVAAGRYTLDDIAVILEREAGVSMHFDWDGLAAVGVTPETEVEVLDGAPPAERLLSMVLFEAAPDAGEVYPTYLLIDGKAIVGTSRSLVRLAPQVSWPVGGQRVVGEETYVRRVLDDTIVNCDFRHVPLEQVIDHLREETGLDIVVDWIALARLEIGMQVSMKFRAVPAALLLDLALEQVSENNLDDEKASFYIIDGVVHVTTLDQITEEVETRVYDVHDLVDRPYGPMLETIYACDEFALTLLREYQLAWFIDLGRIRHNIEFNDGYQNFDVAGIPNTHPRDFSWPNPIVGREASIQQLSHYIRETTGDPDMWNDQDYTLREIDGLFIIDTSSAAHSEIVDLLSRLRLVKRGVIRRFMREVEAARLLHEAEAKRRDGAYRDALELAERAHAVDPGNEPARALRDVLEMTIERLAE